MFSLLVQIGLAAMGLYFLVCIICGCITIIGALFRRDE
jgi:hypothetical protein